MVGLGPVGGGWGGCWLNAEWEETEGGRGRERGEEGEGKERERRGREDKR